MLRSLHGKLSLVLFGLLCLIGVFFVALTLFTTRRYLQEVNQRMSRDLAEHLTSEQSLWKGGRVRRDAIREIRKLMVVNPTVEVYLLGPEGNILAYSASPGKVKRKRVALAPIHRFLNQKGASTVVGDDPKHLDRQKIFSVSPIVTGGVTEGYVYVILGGEEYETAADLLRNSYIVRLSVGMTAGAILFTLAAGLLLFHLLARRLHRLMEAVEAFRRKEFQEAAPVPYRQEGPWQDEIDRLGLTFAAMMERILEQFGQLRQADMQRRELVSNVSHDLRTPLAALQGYLETVLIKEGELTPAEQRGYLTTAIKHTERLGKLTRELFELANLEAGEVQLHAEPFPLGELVQDVVQKYSLGAEKKGLRLVAEVAEGLPFVLAEIAMIERVLENLLENALRHTPEGGMVTVVVSKGPDRLVVGVTDSGHGIQPEDLPHVFNRFYRGDNNRPDTGGAGLGLAIAQRMVELHGGTIVVNSVLNEGTTVTFDLPIAGSPGPSVVPGRLEDGAPKAPPGS